MFDVKIRNITSVEVSFLEAVVYSLASKRLTHADMTHYSPTQLTSRGQKTTFAAGAPIRTTLHTCLIWGE